MAQQRGELKGMPYEIFIAALSLLSIANIALQAIARDEALSYVIAAISALISVVLLGDFLYRLRTAPSRREYFWRSYGWADLMASLPFPQAKVLRLFRLTRVVRLLRGYGTRAVWNALVRDRASMALYSLLLIGLLMLEFGSLAMLRLESSSPEANIRTASDALWYSLVTMSTVGYGDQFPVTNPGRLLGAGIIVVGVGIFGTLTGYLANAFLAPARSDAATKPTDPSAAEQAAPSTPHPARSDAVADPDDPSAAEQAG